ncbi:hypothetical protein Bca4012_019109 [Brassica carinata]
MTQPPCLALDLPHHHHGWLCLLHNLHYFTKSKQNQIRYIERDVTSGGGGEEREGGGFEERIGGGGEEHVGGGGGGDERDGSGGDERRGIEHNNGGGDITYGQRCF